MYYKFQYTTEEEKEAILQDNQDKTLIEIQNITEGNFLIFTDKPIMPTIEERLQALEEVTNLLLGL